VEIGHLRRRRKRDRIQHGPGNVGRLEEILGGIPTSLVLV
jgi:hypothetical protein